MSRRARAVAVALLATSFAGLVALVLGYRDWTPAAFAGAEIGVLVGLANLVFEFCVVDRAVRSPRGDAAGATFQTFAMRLAVVGPITLALQLPGSPADAAAFALAYLSTFFVYLCWLTWETYHAPVQYKGRSKGQGAPRVLRHGRAVEGAGSPR